MPLSLTLTLIADALTKNKSSFIYGQNPNIENVPIYSVVSTCSPENDLNIRNGTFN